jgi:hypothetical protein
MYKLLILLLLVASLPALAQRDRGDQSVPNTVQHNFKRDYPDAKDTRWSSAGGEWHADFTDHSPQDRGEMVAHYDRTGHHIDSHIPYDRNDVPSPVIHNIEKRYPGASDHSFTRIEKPGTKPVFQVTMNLGGKRTNKYVDDQGRERSYADHH